MLAKITKKKDELMGIIYRARNTINGKFYIGKTTKTLRSRKRGHKRSARNGSPFLFYRAIRKYGWKAFKWKILVRSNNENELIDLEIEFIADLGTKIPNGYNMTDGGEGISGLSRKFSDEHKAKLSEALKGRRGKSRSEETKAKISAALKGRTKSKETKAKISRSQKGRKFSKEHKARISKAKRGKKFSEETKARMSISQKKRYKLSGGHSVRTKAKIGEVLKGKKHSDEHNAKVSKALKGRVFSEEHKAKIRAALKGKKNAQLS